MVPRNREATVPPREEGAEGDSAELGQRQAAPAWGLCASA